MVLIEGLKAIPAGNYRQFKHKKIPRAFTTGDRINIVNQDIKLLQISPFL
jgi:hypothetical protein